MVKSIQDLWIFRKDGLTVYKSVISSDLNPSLFGALLSTLNLIAVQVSDDKLKKVKLENMDFIILKTESFLFVANSNKNKKLRNLKKDLEKVKEIFVKKYGEIVLKDWNQDISTFQGFYNEIRDFIEDRASEEELQIEKSREDLERRKIELEAIMRINDLKKAAVAYKLEGNYDDAIICSDHAIRICVQYKLKYDIKEFENFINSIAKLIQKDLLINQINEFGSWISDRYDRLVSEGAILQAHELVSSLKERYKDTDFFYDLKIIKDLVKKDNKEWIKFNTKYYD